jgi:two-component system, OmpR family, phosphate regulon sensor histidine kinase PhoR
MSDTPDLAQNLLASLPDAALLLDGAGMVTFANTLATDALQVNLKGLAITNILRNVAVSDALSAVFGGQPSSEVAIELHGRVPRQFQVHIARVGVSNQFLMVLRDLTREQRIERMRSDFVANASHEMRTPLASILGSIETLQGAARHDEKARDMFLDTMLAQAKRMRRLIDDLLTLGRIELNEHVRPRAKVSLREMARQARSNLTDLASQTEVAVSLADGEDVLVAGDADELLQVVQNLLENALKYGNAGKRIDVTCTRAGSMGRLSVQDFGKGIAEVHVPRLTERFYRVSTQESRARGGTGLGLAIVKHILLRHQGDLEVTSAPNQGSTFAIRIPLAKS